jgi:hypothetical protein
MITTGNAAADGIPFNGWVIGDLTRWAEERGVRHAHPLGLRDTTALEVKWGIHPAGVPRPAGWAAASPHVTVSILVSGEFRIVFRAVGALDEREVILRSPGDYVISDSDTEHTWCAIQDSVVLSVRWPEPEPARKDK